MAYNLHHQQLARGTPGFPVNLFTGCNLLCEAPILPLAQHLAKNSKAEAARQKALGAAELGTSVAVLYSTRSWSSGPTWKHLCHWKAQDSYTTSEFIGGVLSQKKTPFESSRYPPGLGASNTKRNRQRQAPSSALPSK